MRCFAFCVERRYSQVEPGSCSECLFSDAGAVVVVVLGSVVTVIAIVILDHITISKAMVPLSKSAVILKQLIMALTIQGMLNSYVFKVCWAPFSGA